MTATLDFEEDCIVREGEFFIDTRTGEIVGNASFPPDKEIKTAEDVNGLLMHRLSVQSDIDALEAQKATILANLNGMIADAQRRMDYLERFTPQLERYAARHLPKGAKHVKTPFGYLQFTHRAESYAIAEGKEAELIQWAKLYVPEVVKVKESVSARDVVMRFQEFIPGGLIETIPAREVFSIRQQKGSEA